MSEVQIVTARQRALQYDGTNAGQVLNFVVNGYPGGWGNTEWTIGSEEGGLLTLSSSEPGLWSDYVLHVGDHIVLPGNEVLSDAAFLVRFTMLGPE